MLNQPIPTVMLTLLIFQGPDPLSTDPLSTDPLSTDPLSTDTMITCGITLWDNPWVASLSPWSGGKIQLFAREVCDAVAAVWGD